MRVVITVLLATCLGSLAACSHQRAVEPPAPQVLASIEEGLELEEPVPEFPPDSTPSGALADSIHSPENRVSDPRLGGWLPSDIVLISFDPGASQDLRQKAIDLIGGRVIGGVRVHPGAWYIVRIQSDGTAEPLVEAIEALKVLPQVRAATPHTAPVAPTDGRPRDALSEALSPAIIRLGPLAIPQLPVDVARSLHDRGCTVPQTWDGWSETPNNFVRGDFARTGATDWAVLCSDGEVSRIVVVWGNSAACPTELAEGPDAGFVYEMEGEPAFARTIARGASDDHGIEDIFQGKGSVTHHCRDGVWEQTSSSD